MRCYLVGTSCCNTLMPKITFTELAIQDVDGEIIAWEDGACKRVRSYYSRAKILLAVNQGLQLWVRGLSLTFPLRADLISLTLFFSAICVSYLPCSSSFSFLFGFVVCLTKDQHMSCFLVRETLRSLKKKYWMIQTKGKREIVFFFVHLVQFFLL